MKGSAVRFRSSASGASARLVESGWFSPREPGVRGNDRGSKGKASSSGDDHLGCRTGHCSLRQRLRDQPASEEFGRDQADQERCGNFAQGEGCLTAGQGLQVRAAPGRAARRAGPKGGQRCHGSNWSGRTDLLFRSPRRRNDGTGFSLRDQCRKSHDHHPPSRKIDRQFLWQILDREPRRAPLRRRCCASVLLRRHPSRSRSAQLDPAVLPGHLPTRFQLDCRPDNPDLRVRRAGRRRLHLGDRLF